MTQVEEHEVETQGKYQRSIRLTQDMADRLKAVCDHLGVNVGSFLTQVVGEAVSKYEVQLTVKQQNNVMQLLGPLLQHAGELEAEAAEKPKGRTRAKK